MLDAIKDQVVLPALVQFPDLFIQFLQGVRQLFDLGAGVTGIGAKATKARVKFVLDGRDLSPDFLECVFLLGLMFKKN